MLDKTLPSRKPRTSGLTPRYPLKIPTRYSVNRLWMEVW